MIENIRLFDDSVVIPVPTRKQILAKIHVSQGMLGEAKIRAHVLSVVQQALKSSGVAADYIGYLLHHPDFLIRIIRPDQVSKYASSKTVAYIDGDHGSGTVNFIHNENLLQSLSTSSLLHECWHGFWKQLKHLPDLDKEKCPTLSIAGSPLPDQTISSIEGFRRQLAGYFARVLELYTKLDTGKKLTVDERKFVDAIPQSLPITPYPVSATVDQVAAVRAGKRYDWIDSTTGLHLRITGIEGDRLLLKTACSENNKVCRAQHVLGALLNSLYNYEVEITGVSLKKSLSQQLTPRDLQTFKALREAGFSVVDPGHQRSLEIAAEVMSKFGSDPYKNAELFGAAVGICQDVATLTLEADTIMREHPSLLAWNETHAVLQHRRDNLQQWMGCSEKFFAHITVQELQPLRRNACVQSDTPQ